MASRCAAVTSCASGPSQTRSRSSTDSIVAAIETQTGSSHGTRGGLETGVPVNTEEIWTGFRSKLLGYIQARARNVQDAEDILQNVFVKVHRRINTLDDEDRLVAWLYRVTHNTIVDFYRKSVPAPTDIEPTAVFDEDLPVAEQLLVRAREVPGVFGYLKDWGSAERVAAAFGPAERVAIAAAALTAFNAGHLVAAVARLLVESDHRGGGAACASQGCDLR